MIDAKKQARIDEVKALLTDFSKQHLASAPDIVATSRNCGTRLEGSETTSLLAERRRCGHRLWCM